MSNSAPTPPPTPFSLFAQLTTGSPTGSSTSPPGATALIDYLIKVVAHDACSARRNTLTSYKLVEAARKVYVKINGLIQDVKDDDLEDDNDIWTKFDDYSKAITPLERYLFSLAAITETECDKFLPTAHTDVNDLEDLIGKWKTNRTQLRDLTKLAQQDLKTVDSALDTFAITSEGIHDDVDLLSTLCAAINTHALEDSNTQFASQKFIEDLKKSAKDSAPNISSAITGDLMVSSIRCAMLVYGAMDLAKTSVTALEDTAKNVLRSIPVWEQAKKVMGLVKTNLKSGGSVADLDAGWTELNKRLKALEANLPPAYMTLRKAAAAVRRPYFSRTIFLVSQCKLLARHFLKSGKKASMLPPLKDAIGKAQDAIQKANAHADQIKEFQSFNATVTTPNDTAAATAANNAFTEAVNTIKSSFGTYNMTTEQGQVDTALQAEVAIDKELVDLLNAKVASYNNKQSLTTSSSGNTFTVEVKYNSKSTSYTVCKDTLALRNIRCQLALQHSDNTLLKKQFKKGSDGFDIDTKVSENLNLSLE